MEGLESSKSILKFSNMTNSGITYPSKLAFSGIDEILVLAAVVSPTFVYKWPKGGNQNSSILWNKKQQYLAGSKTDHGHI